LAATLVVRHDTLVFKLAPVFKSAVNELIRWKPKTGDNWFRYKITAKWAKDHAPDYMHRIEQPMDLRRIQARTNAKHPDEMYTCISDFEADLRLIASNAMVYNGGSSAISVSAAHMLKYFYNKVWKRTEQGVAAATREAQLSELQRTLSALRADAVREAASSSQAAQSSS
jgi:hypothetical protein